MHRTRGKGGEKEKEDDRLVKDCRPDGNGSNENRREGREDEKSCDGGFHRSARSLSGGERPCRERNQRRMHREDQGSGEADQREGARRWRSRDQQERRQVRLEGLLCLCRGLRRDGACPPDSGREGRYGRGGQGGGPVAVE